jgi:dipeptide transport system ATP-binding protein
MALLEVRDLTVTMPTRRGPVSVVEGIDVEIDVGDVLGIVGESGSGKSVTMLAVMGLLPRYAKVSAGRLAFDGIDLLSLAGSARRRIMGKEIAMIFQEPMTRLNPCFTVGFQIMEMLKTHEPGDKATRRRQAIGLLESVGIPAAESRMSAFPHQLSGGMSQRVMIAMAIACQPRLLIADEPSTALDVTIQAQILDLLAGLQRERQMALVLITHDMAVVSEVADRVMVMYAGQSVELQSSDALFDRPKHPYTSALLKALPEESANEARLPAIPGTVRGLHDRPAGCVFEPRCAHAQPRCVEARPQLMDVGGAEVRCFYPLSTGHSVQ